MMKKMRDFCVRDIVSIKIVVIVRTRDEEHRIGQFCRAYKHADMILVGDGGSKDSTVSIARTFPNVNVRYYRKKTKLKKGYWRNNDSDHVNWLIDWARTYDPDWIISDDCDCRPNYLLRKDFRKILSNTPRDFVMAVRFYVWGKDQHFPHMAKPEKNHKIYEPSLWAWRANVEFKTVNVPPAFTFRIGGRDVKDLHKDAKTLDVFPPRCLIHYSWDDEERVKEKIKVYRESGFIPNMKHPLDFAGPLEPLPDFCHE